MENAAVWIALGAAFVALIPVFVIVSRQNRSADGAVRKKRGDDGSYAPPFFADSGSKRGDSDGAWGSSNGDGGGGDGGGGGD